MAAFSPAGSNPCPGPLAGDRPVRAQLGSSPACDAGRYWQATCGAGRNWCNVDAGHYWCATLHQKRHCDAGRHWCNADAGRSLCATLHQKRHCDAGRHWCNVGTDHALGGDGWDDGIARHVTTVCAFGFPSRQIRIEGRATHRSCDFHLKMEARTSNMALSPAGGLDQMDRAGARADGSWVIAMHVTCRARLDETRSA